jgi:MFS family permease
MASNQATRPGSEDTARLDDTTGKSDPLGESVIRKVTYRLAPLMCLLYVVAYIDRQNIGFAKLQMAASLKLSETAFGLGASLFFIGYLLFEVPSNIVLRKFGPRTWFARILLTWSTVTVALAFTHSTWLFYTLRFLLGAAEAGLYPGLLYCATLWFPLKNRPRIISYLVMASLVANMLSGPLCGILLGLDGASGFEGWQWTFIGTGVVAMLMAIPTLAWFPDKPENATFLDDRERKWLIETLREEKVSETTHGLTQTRKAFTDPRVLLLALVLGFISFGAYGLGYWMPTIVKSFGVGNVVNGFINMIPWVFAIFLLLWLTRKPSRTSSPYLNVALPMFVAGTFLAVSVLDIGPVFRFASLCMVVLAIFSVQPCFWTLSRFLSGGAAAAGLAIINSLANLGGFLAQTTVPLVRDLTGSVIAPMLFLSVSMVIGGCVTLGVIGYLKRFADNC